MFPDYYEILGIDFPSNAAEIKAAYRKMSLRWHPDKNPNVDVTHKMQCINEAYSILKDEDKKARYDREYVLYKQFKAEEENRKNSKYQPNYTEPERSETEADYDIHDDSLKNDINEARQYAKDLVNEFLNSLKKESKNAANGVWNGAKNYVYGFLILFVFGIIVRTCVAINDKPGYDSSSFESLQSSSSDNNSSSNFSLYQHRRYSVKDLGSFDVPTSWKKHEFFNAFSICVPPTVELRKNNDEYSVIIENLGFHHENDIIIFWQKGLSKNSPEARKHYCRVMIQYLPDDPDAYLRKYETAELDAETKEIYCKIAKNESAPASLIGRPTVGWVSIEGGTKAIEVKYRRNGFKDEYTANCKIYIFSNYDKAVKVILSYREQEEELWKSDFENIIKTFKWK